MKDIPTSGPMPRSNTHHALDTTSSRHSFSTSHRNGDLGERKEYLFKVLGWPRRVLRCRQRRQFGDRAFAAHPPAAEQHEPVAEARGIADLMNREEERPPAGRVRAQSRRQVARLAQVEAIER